MTAETPGLELARRFFSRAVEPLVEVLAPDLRYGAALIGDGSEVLGFDDTISRDHDWGPRVLLFLGEEDFASHAGRIMAGLKGALPPRFEAWPTAFQDQDRRIGLDLDAGWAGSERHGVEIHTVAAWIERQLGLEIPECGPTLIDWCALDEQRLLSITSGAVFRDDRGGLAAIRTRLAYLPEDVRLAKMARRWEDASAELPFVGRAGHVGDDPGARIICARLAEHAMRLCFLIDRRYAPYSKWLGTAWARLPSYRAVGSHLRQALAATDWQERQSAISSAFEAIGRRQIEEKVPGSVEPRLERYHSRPYMVVNANDIAAGLRAAVRDRSLLMTEERPP